MDLRALLELGAISIQAKVKALANPGLSAAHRSRLRLSLIHI